jgi:DNA-binding MarR family transcriptional regulator
MYMSGLQTPNGLAHIPQKLFNPYRLWILIYLKMSNEELRFYKLKQLLELTDGNLASHIRALEQEGYVKSSSELDGRRLKSSIGITPEGQKVLREFSEQMKNVLNVLAEK